MQNNSYTSLNQDQRLALLTQRLNEAWAMQLKNLAFAKRLESESVDPNLYLIYMMETFHYTKHNARNQALVGVRAQNVSPHYMKFCFEHAEEETGHELMALHDINSMGIKISIDEMPQPLPETETLVAYLYWISSFGNPLQRLGYSFWAESVYSFIAPLLSKIRTDLNLSNSQMTFFVAHSAIDAAHADEVRTVILENCKNSDDWGAIERVMLTSLDLTLKVTDGILREYDCFKQGNASIYKSALSRERNSNAIKKNPSKIQEFDQPKRSQTLTSNFAGTNQSSSPAWPSAKSSPVEAFKR